MSKVPSWYRSKLQDEHFVPRDGKGQWNESHAASTTLLHLELFQCPPKGQLLMNGLLFSSTELLFPLWLVKGTWPPSLPFPWGGWPHALSGVHREVFHSEIPLLLLNDPFEFIMTIFSRNVIGNCESWGKPVDCNIEVKQALISNCPSTRNEDVIYVLSTFFSVSGNCGICACTVLQAVVHENTFGSHASHLHFGPVIEFLLLRSIKSTFYALKLFLLEDATHYCWRLNFYAIIFLRLWLSQIGFFFPERW